MSTPDPRAAFMEMTRALIEDIRTNGHATSGPWVGRQALLLTTTGARTGAARTLPLAYTMDGGDLIVAASKGGSDSHPAWYLNLLAHPTVVVETEGERFRARAMPVTGEERDRLYEAHAAVHPSFHEYRARTQRTIPVVRLRRIP